MLFVCFFNEDLEILILQIFTSSYIGCFHKIIYNTCSLKSIFCFKNHSQKMSGRVHNMAASAILFLIVLSIGLIDRFCVTQMLQSCTPYEELLLFSTNFL